MSDPAGRAVKLVRDGRLVWYSETPDEAHWHHRWKSRVTSSYYAAAQDGFLERDELGRLLLSVLPTTGRLLEAGCGAGQYVAALQAAGFDVEGIEFSQPLVDLVNRVAPTLPVRFGDALSLDEPDASFDGYVSVGVVEHVEEGPERFLDEAFRLLAPGGRAVVTVPGFGPLRRTKARLGTYGRAASDGLEFYQYGFPATELELLMASAGFVVERSGYTGAHRMLVEELPAYRWMVGRRGGERLVKRPLERLLADRDGHMTYVVAMRP